MSLLAHPEGYDARGTFLPFEKKDLDQSVCTRFEEQAAKYPDGTAVRTRNVTVTYSALNQQVNRIARAILNQIGAEQKQVAHLVTDEAQSIAAILASLKAGKTYVTIDPRHPQDRKLQVLNDAEAELVLTDQGNLETATELLGAGRLLNIEAVPSDVSAENLELAISPDAPACIFFTSGSTGRPKGVLHSHRNLLAWALSFGFSNRISPDDRICMISASTSAQWMANVFSALLNGASVCPFRVRQDGPGPLAAWLMGEEITIYHSSPSVFRSFVQALSGREQFPCLRVIRLGGERVLATDFELYKKHFSTKCIFVNSLGATETGMFREFFADHGTTISGSVVPSGYAAGGTEVLILDDEGQVAKAGSVGEIAVRSDSLALSYWRQPHLTRAAFPRDPGNDGVRMYRTGDLGRLSPDGCLHCLGRKDSQVKIRGNRVELADVEMALRKIEGVQDTAVTTRQNDQGDGFLAAYVVTTNPRPSTAFLRTSLRKLLPDYMVPSVFVMMDSVPMTSHGKVDTRALPEPKVERVYVAPRNATETLLCELWEQILGVSRVGIRDDFLELGGNSLSAARLMNHIDLHFGRNIPFSVLLSVTTVEELAQLIPEQQDGDVTSPLVRMQAGDTFRKPFFFLHGQYNGWGLYCKALAPLLGREQPFYILHPLAAREEDLPATVELMAKQYVRVLRDAQPSGPYLLGGYCNGGLIAFEMAQELRAQGEKVELLVLIETPTINIEFRTRRKLVFFAARLLGLSETEEMQYFARLCKLSSKLRRLSSPQRARFLARKVGKLPRATKCAVQLVGRRFRRSGASSPPQSIADSPDGWGRQQDELNAHYSRLVYGYVPKPYAGRVTIFRAEGEKHPADDPAMGWRSLAEEADSHTIPGDHHGCVSLAENLPILAEYLKSCLDAYHDASPDPAATREEH